MQLVLLHNPLMLNFLFLLLELVQKASQEKARSQILLLQQTGSQPFQLKNLIFHIENIFLQDYDNKHN